jgi:leader peptidase (prepilin peptidase) / N-methyltransferase
MNLIKQHSLNLVTAALFLLAFACLGLNPVLLGVLPFIFGGVILSVIDWKVHRLPSRLVYLTLTGVLAGLAVASVIEWDWKPGAMALAGALIYGNALFAIWFLGKKILGLTLIGFGDVRLALVLGLLLGWFGLLNVWYGFVAGMILGTIVGLVIAVRSRKLHLDIAFGPPLMIGCLLVVLAH